MVKLICYIRALPVVYNKVVIMAEKNRISVPMERMVNHG